MDKGAATVPQPIVTATETVSVQVNLVTGPLVNFSYETPIANKPHSYANAVHLWAVTDDQVPWGRPPQASATIVEDVPAGDQNIKNADITSSAYLVGYAVGPIDPERAWSPYANVVATAFIPAVGLGAAAFSPRIAPRFVGTTSLAFDFAFPPGFDPEASGAWAGLWPGHAASTICPPTWATAVELASDSGTWGFDGLHIDRGSPYTLGLFPTGWRAASRPSGGAIQALDLRPLACAATFTS